MLRTQNETTNTEWMLLHIVEAEETPSHDSRTHHRWSMYLFIAPGATIGRTQTVQELHQSEMHTLSPYPTVRSAPTTCESRSCFGGFIRNAVTTGWYLSNPKL